MLKIVTKVWDTVENEKNREIHKKAIEKFCDAFSKIDASLHETLLVLSTILKKRINDICKTKKKLK